MAPMLYYNRLHLEVLPAMPSYRALITPRALQTSALDGETDLKTRAVAPACMGIDSELLHKIKVS